MKKLLNNILRLTLKQAALASAVIFFVSAGLLAYVYFSGTPGNIKDSPVLSSLKENIEKYPANKTLVERFREVDFQERAGFFRKTELLETGKHICLGFLLLSLLCFRGYSLLTERIPLVKKGTGGGYTPARRAEKNIVLLASLATSLIVLFFLLVFSVLGTGKFPWQIKETVKEIKILTLNPAEQWPGFRGFTGQGLVYSGKYPETWDLQTGKNVSWKTDLPVMAYSSPVVFGDTIFITGSGEKKLKVLSYSASTGALNWASTVMVKTSVDDIEVMSEESGGAGYASPTPVTDGKYVYAYFATNQLVCFDFEGKQQWLKFFGKPDNTYGLSSSPLLYEDKILLQVDQGGEGLSKIYALNKNTGEIVWETKRPDGASWGTPLLIEDKGKKELVTTGTPWVIAYAPETGKELWRVDCLFGEISASPVYGDEKIYVLSVGSQTNVYALVPGGAGDVTKKNIAWSFEEESQAINSALVLQKKLIVAMNGFIVCHDTGTGKIIWQYKLEDDFWASPVSAGDKIYIASLNGNIYVLDLSGKLLSTILIGEKLSASPAFCGGSIYIRTDKRMYCVKEEKKK